MAIIEELFRDDPGRVEAERDLARIYEAIGLLFSEMEQTDRALVNLNRAEILAESCSARDPRNARIQNHLAGIYQEAGDLFSKLVKQPGPAFPDRAANLRSARSAYQRAFELWTESKKKGMLSAIDVAKLDRVTESLAEN